MLSHLQYPGQPALPARSVVPLHPVQCASCRLRTLCLPTGLTDASLRKLAPALTSRRVYKDEALYKMDDPFRSVYAIRFGHFKTFQVSANGEEQITGLHMAGDLLGIDGLCNDRHRCYAVALEDSEVCEFPYASLESLFVQIPPLLRQFHRLISEEMSREQANMLVLGNLSADQRFASFLLDLSRRYGARGYSSTSFYLRMSREDIANYLGLTIESISRIIGRMRARGLVNVTHRNVELLDVPALATLAFRDGRAQADAVH
ncbi:helix-turn-helix domain-containing protein [Noviherbaspirillum galbum]|uniref:Helix-turn-helix domain-containing protein n=1 Tax=Noviherbaspirillum galbum TaxID=2709383 RepID=A0A6B3SNF4_9BURK|nr:helix-turn-helix domain-containing protein [Noviherbaspirillum galbum]NEX62344.1 helix-turn-helix domain-containing protein [Noviherbaspirillum galbum]